MTNMTNMTNLIDMDNLIGVSNFIRRIVDGDADTDGAFKFERSISSAGNYILYECAIPRGISMSLIYVEHGNCFIFRRCKSLYSMEYLHNFDYNTVNNNSAALNDEIKKITDWFECFAFPFDMSDVRKLSIYYLDH